MSGRFRAWVLCLLPLALALVAVATRPAAIALPFLSDGSARRAITGLDAWAYYGWFALVAAVGLLAFVICTRRWWVQVGHEKTSAAAPWSRLEIALCISVCAVRMAVRLPLLTGQMHRDEQDSLVHQMHGVWKVAEKRTARPPSPFARRNPRAEPPLQAQMAALEAAGTRGRAVWQGRAWSETWLGGVGGSNHALNSVLARTCNTAWQTFTGAGIGRFNLVALRLPAFLAASLAVVLMFTLVRRSVGSGWAAGAWAPAPYPGSRCGARSRSRRASRWSPSCSCTNSGT